MMLNYLYFQILIPLLSNSHSKWVGTYLLRSAYKNFKAVTIIENKYKRKCNAMQTYIIFNNSLIFVCASKY